MPGLKVILDVIFRFSRASLRLYRCVTPAFSVSESEIILNGFLIDGSLSPLFNLYIYNLRDKFFLIVQCLG